MQATKTTLLLLFLLWACTGCLQTSSQPFGLYDVQSNEDVEFVRRGNTPLHMDIYRPVGAPQPHPGIVIFHGGGWLFGDRMQMRPMARYLASIGYTAATAEYRLSNKGGQYPAAVADGLAAIKYVRKNAQGYDVDPGRIGAIGYSAGAQLALLAGLVKDVDIFRDDSLPTVSSAVQAVVDISGPTDLAQIKSSDVVVKYMVETYMGGPPDKDTAKYAQASPITHARRDAPPILIMHGERDDTVRYLQAVNFADALKRAGVAHELVSVPQGDHVWNFPFGNVISLRALPIMTQFLAENLMARPSNQPQTNDAGQKTESES